MNKDAHPNIGHPELAVNFTSESQVLNHCFDGNLLCNIQFYVFLKFDLLDIEDTIKNIHKYDVELRKYTKRWHEGENWGKSRRKDDSKKRAAERAALAALEVSADEVSYLMYLLYLKISLLHLVCGCFTKTETCVLDCGIVNGCPQRIFNLFCFVFERIVCDHF